MDLLLDVGERLRATIAKMVAAVRLAGSMTITTLSSDEFSCATDRRLDGARPFVWFNVNRVLSKGYEHIPASAKGWIKVAGIYHTVQFLA